MARNIYSRITKYILAAVMVIIILLGIAIIKFRLFGGDYSIGLQGGYTIHRIYAQAFLITDPNNRVVIHPNVERYNVFGNFVIGKVSTQGLTSPEHISNSIPGYFIINTASGSVQ